MHDNRRSAVRNFDRAGIPRDIAKKLSGHLTDSMYSRYNIGDEQDMDDATAKLGQHLKEKKPKEEVKNSPVCIPGDIPGTVVPISGRDDWGPGA